MPISERWFRRLFGGKQRLALLVAVPLVFLFALLCWQGAGAAGAGPPALCFFALLMGWAALVLVRPEWLIFPWTVRCERCGQGMETEMPVERSVRWGRERREYTILLRCHPCERETRVGTFEVTVRR